MVSAFLKEFLETILRGCKKFFSKVKLNDDERKGLIGLEEQGFSIIEDYWSKEKCDSLIVKIDKMISDPNVNVWVDETGSDHRVYFANSLDEEFEKFYQDAMIRNVMANYTGVKKPKGFVMAARIDAKNKNLGSGGGWHRDSPFTHQFKALCYLNDVKACSGPFQYISMSHKKKNILASYLNGVFKPGQYRFKDSDVERYLSLSSDVIEEIVAPAGTLTLVDTKGVHRGKPIQEGSRYVLFSYFWHGEIPAHFNKLNQS